jgi:hypothetical protein
MFEGNSVNPNPPSRRSQKIVQSKQSVSRPTDQQTQAPEPNLSPRLLTELQWARIINASCKSFFIKRGLDPTTEELAQFLGEATKQQK